MENQGLTFGKFLRDERQRLLDENDAGPYSGFIFKCMTSVLRGARSGVALRRAVIDMGGADEDLEMAEIVWASYQTALDLRLPKEKRAARLKMVRAKAANARKPKKEVPAKIDGLNPKDVKRIRNELRDIWRHSEPRKRCLARVTKPDESADCEGCGKNVPKVYVDHIDPIGGFDPRTFIERMWRPSTELQALCKACHRAKTNAENKARRDAALLDKDFA